MTLLLALALLGAQDVNDEEDVAGSLEALYRRAAEKASPCVVSIMVEREPEEKKTPRSTGGMGGLFDGGVFKNRPLTSPCCGTILEEDGTLVTTAFNIGGKVKSIEVTLGDGRTFKGELKGINATYDLAVIKIEATGLPTLGRSNLERIKTGQTVVVVGRCPNRKGVTVNPGIVSAPSRMSGRGLQMDSRMNYGNVGAPLVDVDGRLIGITCRVDAKYAGSHGQNSGVGFAVTWDRLNEILPDLKKGKVVAESKRPFLGIRADDLAEGIVGARLTEVTAGSAAEKAGLKIGDVITEFDGKKVRNFEELRALIVAKKAGDKVKIKIVRGEEEKEIEATLGEAPGE